MLSDEEEDLRWDNHCNFALSFCDLVSSLSDAWIDCVLSIGMSEGER